MRPPQKNWPWLLVVPLLVLVMWTCSGIVQMNCVVDPATGDFKRDKDGQIVTNYRRMSTLSPGHKGFSLVSGLHLPMLFGLKPALADILWVKADSYFHSGRYDRILPVCYLVTWLNPQFLDVYIIGAWHMAYNFMDRRYIPPGVEFLEKGIENNPDKPDLYFEQGNMLVDKAQDFARAVPRLREANKLGLFPAGKRHLLAHALEKDGRIEEAKEAWRGFIEEETKAKNWVMASVSKHNLDLTIWRQEDRKNLAQRQLNATFDYTWSIPKPRKVRLSGTTNIPDYSRVNVILRDKNYDQLVKEHPNVGWQIANLTLYWDNFSVVGGKWATWSKPNNLEVDRMDLASEPAKYPLTSKEYEVILTVNPRVEPIQTQDRLGWDGEGLGGPHVVTVMDAHNKPVRMIRESFIVTRDQLLGRAPVPAPVKQALAR